MTARASKEKARTQIDSAGKHLHTSFAQKDIKETIVATCEFANQVIIATWIVAVGVGVRYGLHVSVRSQTNLVCHCRLKIRRVIERADDNRCR